MKSASKSLLFAALMFSFGLACNDFAQSDLRVSFTTPNQGQTGDCSLPSFRPLDAGVDSVRVDIVWTGPRSGSLIIKRGVGEDVDRLLLESSPPPGNYTITVRPRIEYPDTVMIGCPSSISVEVKAPRLKPAAIVGLRADLGGD